MSQPALVLSRTRSILPLLLAGAALALMAAKAKQCVPTPTELYCEYDSQCGGPAPADAACDGAWACVDAGCEWICSGGETQCYSSAECGAGQHCSVDDGACNAPGACAGDMNCFAACAGTCVDDTVATCTGDWDCPNGMVCDYGMLGGGGTEKPMFCPPCDDPALPCDCGGVPAPAEGVCVTPVETCDGMDNDGDGLVDEDGVCGGSECYSDWDCPSGWLCDGYVNGCGGTTDPTDPNGGVAAPCYIEAGTCVLPQNPCGSDYECPEGTFCAPDPNYNCPKCLPNEPCAPCMPPMGVCQVSPEEVCDGMDNDGDGLVDEDGCASNQCNADIDCAQGELCTAIQTCWDFCDPATGEGCGGGCGVEYVCMAAP